MRIEDTDKAREVEGAVDNIKQSLKWLGLDWSDTFVQSDRLDIYRQHAQELYEKGLAYADPFSPEEVSKLRLHAKKSNQAFLFRNFRPENPPDWDGSKPLRLRITKAKKYQWHDIVRGQLSAGAEALDDIILMKSDGYPTYNFAHIVDDHETQISHVIRGDEFLASMPNYLAIHDAFGWQPPNFATVPPILGVDGNKKLSKRDGAQAVLDYRDQGYLPDALINFLALLGWNDGTEQEIYSREELVQKFALERIQKAGAKFDKTRLDWLNAQHIRQLNGNELYKAAEPFWPDSAKQASAELKQRLLKIERERLRTLGDLRNLDMYYFSAPSISGPEISAISDEFTDKTGGASLKEWLKEVGEILNTVGDSKPNELEKQLRQRISNHGGNPGTYFSMLRVVLTNADSTPPIWDLVYILGKSACLARLDATAKLL